jgi:hypothetical protein
MPILILESPSRCSRIVKGIQTGQSEFNWCYAGMERRLENDVYLLLRLHRVPYFIIIIFIIIILNSSYTQTWVCLNCMEFYSVYWRKKKTKKLIRIQRKFAAMCQYSLFTYDVTRMFLNFWSFTPCTTEGSTLMHIFFISIYSGLTCRSFLLDITGIRVLTRNS